MYFVFCFSFKKVKHRICQFGIWPVRHHESKLNSHHRHLLAMHWPLVRIQKYAFHAAVMVTSPFGIYTIKLWYDNFKDTQTVHHASISVRTVHGYGPVDWITQFVHGIYERDVNCNNMISVHKFSHSAIVRLVCFI